MKNGKIIVLFGIGVAIGVLPMLLFLRRIRTLAFLLFPGITLTFFITGDTHSEAGLVWMTVFNALVYGMIGAGVGWIVSPRKQLPGNICGRCSYDLTGNVSGVCPECGTPVGQNR